jgi:PAS domain S-box-containing protein
LRNIRFCPLPRNPAESEDFRAPRSKVRLLRPTRGGFALATHVRPKSDEEPERLYAEDAARLRLLLEASSTLLGSLEIEAMLPKVLDLASRTLAADAYALWQTADAVHWDVAAHNGLSEEYVASATQAIQGNAAVVSFDNPIVAEDIPNTEWLTAEHRAAHAAEGNRSMMALPLRYGERILGTLTFYYREPRLFTEAEKSSASLLANLAAAAIGTAELYQAQRRLAEDRKFVAEASELLASSLDYETTLRNVAALAVPDFADWCTIDIVAEDERIERLAVAHVDPDKVRFADELQRRYPPDPDAPYGVPNVIRTGEPELFTAIPEELLREATKDAPELFEILVELGLKSSMCVPLKVRERVLGAITFVSAESGRRYDEADLTTAHDLARRAAIAVDNARLFGAAESAGRRAQESLSVVDAVFAGAPVGLALMDTEYRYMRVNEALAQMNGVPVEEHFGKTLRDVLGYELASRIEPLHRQVLETGQPILDLHFEGKVKAKPHEIQGSLVSYYPVNDVWGDKIGVGVVITDVSEREQALALAEQASARLELLAEASQTLASSLDYEETLAALAELIVPNFADWYAVDVLDDDGTFRRLTVVHKDPAKAEWAEKSRDLYPPDLQEAEGTGRAVRTGDAVLYQYISDDLLATTTKDSLHYRTLHELGMESAMVVPLTAAGRTFGGLMLVSSDPEHIYDEDDLEFAKHLGRRAAVAVDNARLYRAAEERARAAIVVEHVADGVMLLDRDGILRLWNPAAEQITGLPAADVVGRAAAEIFARWDSVAELTARTEVRPETRPAEINGRELWLSITGVDFGDGSVFAFRDLTAERAVEALKSDFVSTVSHELRTPLAAIYGAALTLRRDDVVLGEPQRTGLLEVIASESDRLARIVNDILWASRLESGAMQMTIETCDGLEIAASVVEAARHYIPPSIDLTLEAPENPPKIAADPDKVRQVLTNLVDNAVKYSPDGGRVTVDLDHVGSRMRFAVHDEGLGVPPAEHRRIFEKFYRLDPHLTRGVGGTGLGLYISRELLERMGGRIWVESSGNGGSTFVAELPVAA